MGRTPGQIRQEFVGAYGQWILLAPSRSGINLVAWVLPLLLVLGGLVTAVFAIRRWTVSRVAIRSPVATARTVGQPEHGSPGDGLSPADRRLLERELARIEEETE